jgi:hypothetical protein
MASSWFGFKVMVMGCPPVGNGFASTVVHGRRAVKYQVF